MLSVLKTATLSESDVYGRNFAEMFCADADFLLPEMSFSADLTGCKYNHSEFCCICQIFHSFFDCHFFMAVIFRTVQVCKIGIYNRFASDKANLSTIFGRKGKSSIRSYFFSFSFCSASSRFWQKVYFIETPASSAKSFNMDTNIPAGSPFFL